MGCSPKEKDARKAFLKIYSKAHSLGITTSQLAKLKSLQKVSNRPRTQIHWSVFVLSGITIASVLALVLNTSGRVYTCQGFSRFWLWWENLDEKTEFCTVDMPTSFQNAFMRPFECSICKNLTLVERVRNIDPGVFEENFANTAVPVIVTDAMSNWSASEKFGFEFFKKLYPPDIAAFLNSKRGCQFFPYKSKFQNLAQVFEMSHERATMKEGTEPWYIGWSNCDQSIANVLRKHYHRPYFLPSHSEGTSLDWIFMGSPGYGAHMHVDHVGKPSWQAQIQGQKIWTLEPPLECLRTCHALEVTVSSGEIIVLDTNVWYHKTLIAGEELSISIGSEFD